ncbi:hypothetical protein GWK47_012427 [Chionoecetes opilio]|uniref:Uncharacterized protein n=1 Tax=Chionoecetes opilio TaxID=41210 RepID=A0A8J4XWV8_CHIOP|nr:hypothetical protein GWK47_012427 [Chionoecetes opilio]
MVWPFLPLDAIGEVFSKIPFQTKRNFAQLDPKLLQNPPQCKTICCFTPPLSYVTAPHSPLTLASPLIALAPPKKCCSRASTSAASTNADSPEPFKIIPLFEPPSQRNAVPAPQPQPRNEPHSFHFRDQTPDVGKKDWPACHLRATPNV